MKWFQTVIEFDEYMLDSYHGYALCAFKFGKPELAIIKLNKAIEILIQ